MVAYIHLDFYLKEMSNSYCMWKMESRYEKL